MLFLEPDALDEVLSSQSSSRTTTSIASAATARIPNSDWISMMPTPRISMWNPSTELPRPIRNPAGAPCDVHLIVGDQAMTSLDEIQHAFGLANPAAPHEKEPDSVDVRQRAVQESRWRELRLRKALIAP